MRRSPEEPLFPSLRRSAMSSNSNSLTPNQSSTFDSFRFPAAIYRHYILGGYQFVALSESSLTTLEEEIVSIVTRDDASGDAAIASEVDVLLVDSITAIDQLTFDPLSKKIAYIGEDRSTSADVDAVVAELKSRYPGIVRPSLDGRELIEALEGKASTVAPLPLPSVLWEIIAYVIVTIAELCISVVGLELAFTAAPPSMKGFITGCFLLTVFLGNMINSVITPFYPRMSAYVFFGVMAGVMIPVTLAFVFIARNFNRTVARLHAEEQANAARPLEDLGNADVPPGA